MFLRLSILSIFLLFSSPPPSEAETRPLEIVLPRNVGPQDVVLGSSTAMSVGPHTTIARPEGGYAAISNVGTQPTRIGNGARVGSIWSFGPVDLRQSAQVDGSVSSGDQVRLKSSATVSGLVTEYLDLQPVIFRRTIDIGSGAASSVTVERATSRSLSPGNYDTIEVRPEAELILEPGTFVVRDLVTLPSSRVIYNDSEAPVFVYVTDTLVNHAQFSERAQGDAAGNALVAYLGTEPVDLSGPFLGTLVAPLAPLTILAVDDPHVGAFFAREIVVAPDTVIQHRAFPSFLIRQINVSSHQVCPGENLRVSASLQGIGDTDEVIASINRLPGNERVLQFVGTPGPRRITVVASSSAGITDARTIEVELLDCADAAPIPVVKTQVSVTDIGTVEFSVVNADELPGINRRFLWDFGDGSSAATEFPFTAHSYVDSFNATDSLIRKETLLRVTRDGLPDAITAVTVVLWNQYVLGKQRGVLQPPTFDAEAARIVGDQLVATVAIRNPENAPLAFSTERVERHFCDPDRDPSIEPDRPITLDILPGAQVLYRVDLPAADFGPDVCALGVVLRGPGLGGAPVFASAYFEIRDNPTAIEPVADDQALVLLNQVAASGLVSDPNRIVQEELRTLFLEGRSGSLPRAGATSALGDRTAHFTQLQLQQIEASCFPSAPAPGTDVIGHVCIPGEPPPRPGVTCQATEDWCFAPPLVRNALKGDLLLVAACGEVGTLLQNVQPPQRYTHEAIMTRNYYTLSESTRDAKAVKEHAIGRGVDGGWEADFLRCGWPGSLHWSVDEAFNGGFGENPDGVVRELGPTFRPDLVSCTAVMPVSPPLVVKPFPGTEPSVRGMLHEAADTASGVDSHYRLFGFSDAEIAFDSGYNDPCGEPATVSTSFIWYALRLAGIRLEGDEPLSLEDLEPGELALRPAGVDGATRDGLYLYTEGERRAAGEALGTEVYNGCVDSEWYTGAVEEEFATCSRTAAQLLNCFALDVCEPLPTPPLPPPPDPAPWRNPGTGRAVSPDNFLMWDAPPVGVYGYSEGLAYRSGEFNRLFRFAPSAGTGTVSVHVQDSGEFALANALVTVAGIELRTDGNGDAEFLGVPAGDYVVEGQCNEPACSSIVDPGVFLSGREPVTVLADGISSVTLVLFGPEEFRRRVMFTGTCFPDQLPENTGIIVRDGECEKDHEYEYLHVVNECQVDPFNRTDSLTLSQCSGGEVLVNVRVECRLETDNRSVQVRLDSELREGGSCSPDEVEDTDSRQFTLSPDESMPVEFELDHTDTCIIPPGANADDHAWICLEAINARQF